MPFRRMEGTVPHKYTKYILAAFIVIEIGCIVGALLCWQTDEYIPAIFLGFLGMFGIVRTILEMKKIYRGTSQVKKERIEITQMQMRNGFGNLNIYSEAVVSLIYFPLLLFLGLALVVFPLTTPKERFNALRGLFNRRTKTIGRVSGKRTVVKEFGGPSPSTHTGYRIAVGQLQFNVTKRVYNWLRYSDEVVVEHWPPSKCVARIEKLKVQ